MNDIINKHFISSDINKLFNFMKPQTAKTDSITSFIFKFLSFNFLTATVQINPISIYKYLIFFTTMNVLQIEKGEEIGIAI